MSVNLLVRHRIFIALLVLALAVAFATGACGSDDEEGSTPAADVTPQAQETQPAGERPSPAGATAEIAMVPSIQFDKSDLRIASDTDVTITADNQEQGVSHSFAVYESEEAANNEDAGLGETDICAGPCTKTVTLNLAAGQYFFRCEVHPSTMTGTLIAE